jgi:predicted RNA-binding Zn-ribbon protein involved in translation (DUF1610 family)
MSKPTAQVAGHVGRNARFERQVIMSGAKKKAPEKFNMVLYNCPNCGNLNLKEVEMIRNNDTWECPYCHTVFETA